MAKGEQQQRRRAPVIRGRKRGGGGRRVKVAGYSMRGAEARRGRNAYNSSRSAAAAVSNNLSSSTTTTASQQVELRNMRAERRRLQQQLADSEQFAAELRKMKAERDHLSQQLADSENRAKGAEEDRRCLQQQLANSESFATELRDMKTERNHLSQLLVDVESRVGLAEEEQRCISQQLAESDRRAKLAEEERDKLLQEKSENEEGPVLRDQGTELWQNIWSQADHSIALSFPTKKSVVCESVYEIGGNDMPGVHSEGAITNGRTTQSIWMKGMGYTLVGLVTSEEEKIALRHHAGRDFTKMPMMTSVFSPHSDEREGDVFTLEVDMIERRAELFISDKDSSRQLTPHTTWENLPDEVWVAVAFKRNSGREAVLMPCIHHNIMAEE